MPRTRRKPPSSPAAARKRAERAVAPPAPPWAPGGGWEPPRAWDDALAPGVIGVDPALAGPLGLATLDERGGLVDAARVQIETPDGQDKAADLVCALRLLADTVVAVTEADAYRNRAWQLGQAVGLLRGVCRLGRLQEVRTSTWRRWAYGWLPEREQAKQMAVDWARWRWGVDLPHDAAEAAVVAAWRRAELLAAATDGAGARGAPAPRPRRRGSPARARRAAARPSAARARGAR